MCQAQGNPRNLLAPQTAAPPLVNRLTIGHLLLWIATTAVALTWLVGQRPPPPEKIGFATFLSQPGTDVEADMAEAQRQIWRQWQKQYLVGLASAPIYGAALAGATLAVFRLITRRRSFPVQPGHWLLILVAVFALLVAARPHLGSLLRSSDGPDFLVALLMTAMSLFATALTRDNSWRIPFAFAAVGCSALCLAYVPSFFHPTLIPSRLFVAGLFLLAGLPLSTLIAAMTDIRLHVPRDTFHWAGAAALFGVVAQIAASVLVIRL